jgi:2-polyprenyl-3-methyl-5-hydroxy-6-metoxy-1,4-benzoquinol methylase
MVNETEIKRNVREFYDQVGWQEISEGIYQNATYEDLRPVSHTYIHDCHMRVNRHLNPTGKLLLDAGSGPIQYPEYIEYSRGYQKRVCADISFVAIQEARRRIGSHGLFVVADIANLPFTTDTFDGIVSMHTIHHLPLDEHLKAYQELYRVLGVNAKAVVINGWSLSPLMSITETLADLLGLLRGHKRTKKKKRQGTITLADEETHSASVLGDNLKSGSRTYVRKHNAAWVREVVSKYMPLEIWVWRSVNVRFLRTFIREKYAGKFLLRILYWLEERFPHFLGKVGQYPLIVIRK